VEFPGLIRRVSLLPAEEFAPSTIYVEDTSNAVALIQAIRGETHMPIVAVPAKGSKESRAEGVTGVCEAQKVFLPREAPWLVDFERELFASPAGKNDDQVDAFVGALSKVAMQPRAMSWTWGSGGIEDLTTARQTAQKSGASSAKGAMPKRRRDKKFSYLLQRAEA
jgi:predicted phage terminase large subunit-like protein